jgi:hypothetical protein
VFAVYLLASLLNQPPNPPEGGLKKIVNPPLGGQGGKNPRESQPINISFLCLTAESFYKKYRNFPVEKPVF